MSEKFEKYILEAEGKTKVQIPSENPYRDIGFDGDNQRLGWVRVLPFEQVRQSLENADGLLSGKDDFIFIGMGGSINGIKPLISLFGNKNFHTLDNLDPSALSDIMSKVKDLKKTAVIAISKSGTTKETQLLAQSVKDIFIKSLGEDIPKKNFLWLSDPSSFAKLDSLGWEGFARFPIQFDSKTDIGGRFSSPHTLIFILPLFLLLNKDFEKLEAIYNSFVSLQPEIRHQACLEAKLYEEKTHAYFSPITAENVASSFSSWIIQLFQESLGSKIENLPVKTLPNAKEVDLFSAVMLDVDIEDPVVSLMSQMYFYQVLIAYYSALKGINFVTQGYVEQYKNKMRALEEQPSEDIDIASVDIAEAVNTVKERISEKHHFIEVVLYFHPSLEVMDKVKKAFEDVFKQKQVVVFVGSDWNHQSYQAAFADKDTFYVLLFADNYNAEVSNLNPDIIKGNVSTLKLIAKATYLTIKEKSILCSLKR